MSHCITGGLLDLLSQVTTNLTADGPFYCYFGLATLRTLVLLAQPITLQVASEAAGDETCLRSDPPCQ